MTTDKELGAAAFENHPDAMWIYDLESLRFLAVNHAALLKYGYSREEFLSMTIADIRPTEDVAALMDNVHAVTSGLDRAGIWRHRLKDGRVISVDITSHTMDYQGVRAELVSARDVTRLVELERENQALVERERELRREAQRAAAHFRSLFESAPGKFLVLTPDDFEIVAVSDAYLDATRTRREEIEGRRLFDVFPCDPVQPEVDGPRNLRRSLQRVAASGISDVMAVQRYPIPRPAHLGGGFEERYFSPVNTPVVDRGGGIAYIIHRVEDVTPLVEPDGEGSTDGDAGDWHRQLELDVLLRSRELQAINHALREHEANLRTAQRLLGLGIWKLDLDSGALNWSDNLYAMYGIEEHVFGHTFDAYVELVHPDDREAMLANYEEFEATPGVDFRFEHRINRPDGKVVEVHGIGERTDSVEGRFITGVVQDITEQRRIEAKVREADALLRLAGETARFGAWRVILDSENILWSDETAAIHELPEGTSPTLEEAIEFYAPEYRDHIRRVFSACAEQGVPFDELLELITARGNRIWVRAIGEAEFDEHGKVWAVHGAFQDVSELMQARDEARTLSRRLWETLESISDAFYMLDHDFNFVFLNSQAERLLKRRRDELIGRSIWREFPETLGSVFQEQYERAACDRVTCRFTEFYAPLEGWFQVSVYPTADGLAVYFSDETERRELEERLRQSQKLESIGQLTGGIAHDFNNLLTVIIGNAELLSARLDEQPKLRRMAEMVVSAADRGAGLTNRLLAFARRQTLDPKHLDVNRLVEGMEGLLRRSLGEDIDVEIFQCRGLWVAEIDSGQLENALLNLAINARDAMPDGGRLVIETANASLDENYANRHGEVTAGNYVSISVSDSGTGMSPEIVDRAFDPFFTTKEVGRGSGLGLSMVYGFVKQSGGHAKIYSEIGEGTVVRLYFPRALDGPEESPESVADDSVVGGHEHILVVEDDDLVRQNVIAQLAALGYRVTSAADGPHAIEVLRRERDIDLLFTDVVMPGGMNGRQLADAARELSTGIKVLFTSGYSENAIVHQGRLDRGVLLLGKPYRRSELAAGVRRALDD